MNIEEEARIRELENKVGLLAGRSKKERNSEGWGYVAACLCASVALYLGLIDQIIWGAVVLGDTVMYGIGRIAKKLKEEEL